MVKPSIQDFLVVSDIDGTLVTHQFIVPERNIEAIEGYVKRGGNFTIASGRSVIAIRKYARMLDVKLPVIAFNGAVLYDFQKEETVWRIDLEQEARDIVLEVMEKMPQIGVEIFIDDVVYILRYNPSVVHHIGAEGLKVQITSYEKLPGHWLKVLFCAPKESIDQLLDYLTHRDNKESAFVRSGNTYLELLPKDINKATAMHRLCEMHGFSLDHTAAIGDFYNDLQMVQDAGFGAVVGGAPRDLAQKADMETCRCEEGAVADLIEYVEEHLVEQ